jgi:hypothetical protein
VMFSLDFGNSSFNGRFAKWMILPSCFFDIFILLLTFLLLQPAFLLFSLLPKTDKTQHRNKAQQQQTTLVSKVFEMFNKRIELLMRNPNLQGPF